ncbi:MULTISPECIES: 1,2-phenylacetyl-CoA epoxidase subunit PaaB [Haloferax]|uniref:1,2-phenylacetyl-CoA epoxidase, subunit B n=1 Tax=Haloferax massiliensis TaxID=1476858 RepID=A0A0D6JVD2_9EURY|nr:MULTISPECIES: 1,2-phenylacetyl-CoA epoxidase subunit PaaB [Haloferax]MDS0242443.1 phenylacetic acid degradation protein PaaB [Haloferax sp. S2CR25]MDS0445564.1 phenylacetic acid degradation protein PaaB [Haloferax sp. S2CR25-2]CQR52825.1 1,2-phenylacetyl-CoA epoxidase, subunit B [Haloferax massiliensis]
MIWEVFRQDKPGAYHKHCGNVHAPDRELALQFAAVQHGRRMKTHSLWVVPHDEIGEIDADETSFGGTTDKAYRWATSYTDIEPAAPEVAESEAEQADVEKSLEADS